MAYQIEQIETDERPDTSAVGHIEMTRQNAEQLPGLFRLLTLEHARILEQLLALHYEAQNGDAPSSLIERIVRAIDAHEAAETAVLEPRLSDSHRSRHAMLEHADGAENLRRLGNSLARLADTPEYASTVEQMVAMFQQHTRHEETELFVFGQSELDANDPELQQQYEQARAEALRGPITAASVETPA